MNTKGFTLIELLAVIVILAVIALIASPIILNIIENARESSMARSVEAYADAIEQAYATAMSNPSYVGGDVKIGTDGTDTYAYVGTDVSSAVTAGTATKVEYSGSTVSCDTVAYDSGYLTLTGCVVGSSEKKFNLVTDPSAADTTNGAAVLQS